MSVDLERKRELTRLRVARFREKQKQKASVTTELQPVSQSVKPQILQPATFGQRRIMFVQGRWVNLII
jgi:hypothetical protein